jgi:PAS domain-containing protein
MTHPLLAADLVERLDQVFGDLNDPMPLVARRARLLLPEFRTIAWEGDAGTFQFLYVSDSAAALLGYPTARWLQEPTFWADVIIHPEDRDYAVSYCALATGQGKDHDFLYRAVAADGTVLRLHDFVRLVPGRLNIPTHLRGIMIDVTGAAEDESVG